MKKVLFIAMAALTALAMTIGAVPVQAAMTDYVDTNVSFSQGLQKDGNPVPPARSDPSEALGPEDGGFVSLGYGGEIVLGFPSYVGGSLVITALETTNSDDYPEEKADVYVSEDGNNWSFIGTADNQADDPEAPPYPSVFDLGDDCIKYVKLVDTTDGALHDDSSDGYDMDAVRADYDEECSVCDKEEGDDMVANSNEAVIFNDISVKANTGYNYAGGSYGGDGGNGGAIINEDEGDVEDSSTGNGGSGAGASTGGTIMTGNASANANVLNRANTNRTLIDRCACPGDCCDSGDSWVVNRNRAAIFNSAATDANTGFNEADGSYGGEGGSAGDIHNNGEGDVEDSMTGTGGQGASASEGGLVQTGQSNSRLDIVNVVNRNITRILR